MKKITAVLLALTFVLAVSSCSKNVPEKEDVPSDSVTLPDVKEISDTNSTNSTDTDDTDIIIPDESWPFLKVQGHSVLNDRWNRYSSNFEGCSIDYQVGITEEELKKYSSQFICNGGSVSDTDSNMYSFIKYFDITKEKFEEMNKTSFLYTRDEIDVMFSTELTKADVYRYFAAQYSILAGEEVYTLQWLYEHNAEDYKNAGITYDDIEDHIPYFENVLMDGYLEWNDGAIMKRIKYNQSRLDKNTVSSDKNILPEWKIQGKSEFTDLWREDTYFGRVPELYSSLVDEDEFSEFKSQFRRFGGDVSDQEYNIYNFIRYFNIPKNVFTKTLYDHVAKNEPYGLEDEARIYKKEEIILIYDESKTKEEVYSYFVSDNAILKGDNIYTISWLYNHDAEDYIKAGIELQDIEGKLPSFEKILEENNMLEWNDGIILKYIKENVKITRQR